MKPQTAIATARKLYRLEAQEWPGGKRAWMVLDKSNNGHGVHGDEAKGRAHYENVIMFHALKMLDAEHDWHKYDWHTLNGTADVRVALMLAWRAKTERAAAESAGLSAFIDLIKRGRPR